MKKNIYTVFLIMGLMTTSCDLNELPQASITPETFFTTENDLQLYTNSFYNAFPGASSFYNENVDITTGREIPEIIRGAYVIPNTGGGWSWGNLRNINFYLEHSIQCNNENARNRWDAVAKFFRAYFYYGMVAKFGDVPYYDYVVGDNSEGLTAPRDSRVFVTEKMIEDLDFAIEYLPTSINVEEVNKWTALALKSRICLFEGTWRKYHTEYNLPDANKLLQLAADAAEQVMKQGPYELHNTSNKSVNYMELFNQDDICTDEVILARRYSAALSVYHDANYSLLSTSSDIIGLEKAFVNSYLMKDGTRFTDKSNYEKMQFVEECQNRDPRLAQTIRTPGYTREGVRKAASVYTSITGYTIHKYLSGSKNDANMKDESDIPLFRLGEVLLNYAEAKAELGTLTQNDIDATVNALRKRVGMTGMLYLDQANTNPDTYLETNFYPGVTGNNKGVILEIRRERAIELVQEGFRWNDMCRWKAGSTFTRTYKGMYFTGIGTYDLDNDGNIDLCIYTGERPQYGNIEYKLLDNDIILENGVEGGNMLINSQWIKAWNENRDYLYPIPIQERLLNPNLTQNRGWDDGI